MYYSFGFRTLVQVAESLNKIQKQYDVEVLGFSDTQSFCSVLVKLSIKETWESDEDDPPQEFPTNIFGVI